jgi:lysophospholipase L1-like esterase
MMTSCSGIGIQAGYVDFTMKQYYPCQSYFRNAQAKYVPTRVPDAVVINLGTNDVLKKADTAVFAMEVKNLINNIRATYQAEVPIVWAYDMMSYGCFTWARPVLAELGGERASIYTVQLTRNNAGAGHHPALEGHYKSSEQLVQFILDKKLLDKVN